MKRIHFVCWACLLCILPLVAQSQVLPDGTYYIRSALGRYLDVQWGNPNAGTPLHLWDHNGGAAQRWKLVWQGSYYTLQSDLGRYLDVDNARPDAGVKVHLWDYNGSIAQQWRLIPTGDGSYYIQSAVGTYLDVQNAAPDAGTPIWMYPFNGSVAQRWVVEPLLQTISLNVTTGLGTIDITPGTISILISEPDGTPAKRTNHILYQLLDSSGQDVGYGDIQHLGQGRVKLLDILPGNYTLRAYYNSGGSGLTGDSFSWVEEINLVPTSASVRVPAGAEADLVEFRYKE